MDNEGTAAGSRTWHHRVRYLDALELENPHLAARGHLTQLLDPSADRWKEGPSFNADSRPVTETACVRGEN